MVKRIKRLPLYFIGEAGLLVTSFLVICTFTKSAGFLLLNTYHSSFLDVFFKILTNLGDGVPSILLIIFIYTQKKKKSLHPVNCLCKF